MTDEERNVVHILSAKAAEPNPLFKESLLRNLENRELQLTGKKSKRRTAMSTKVTGGLFAGMILLSGLLVWLVMHQRNDNGEDIAMTQETATDQSTQRMAQSSTMSSELAGDDVQDPLSQLSFTPKQTTILLGSEVPDPMRVGTGNGMVDDTDTLYMSFSDESGVMYTIVQTTKSGNYPEDALPVTITVGGTDIQASYYVVSEESDPSGTSPRTYLFWSDGGIYFQISEYGRVSKDDLIRLANSLL